MYVACASLVGAKVLIFYGNYCYVGIYSHDTGAAMPLTY